MEGAPQYRQDRVVEDLGHRIPSVPCVHCQREGSRAYDVPESQVSSRPEVAQVHLRAVVRVDWLLEENHDGYWSLLALVYYIFP